MYYQKEELFWRERQAKLKMLSGLDFPTVISSPVFPSPAQHPPKPSLLRVQDVHCGLYAGALSATAPTEQFCLGRSSRQQLQLHKHVLALAELREDLAEGVRAAEAGKLAAAERKLAEQRRLERQLAAKMRRACSGIEEQEERVQALVQEVDFELRACSGVLQASGGAPDEPDLARMAAQIDALRRKKAALSLSHGGTLLAAAPDLIPAYRPAHFARKAVDAFRRRHSPTADNSGAETLSKPRAFVDLRQALNLPGTGSLEADLAQHVSADLSHDVSAESTVEGAVYGEEAQLALQSMLGEMERQHKQGMADVVQSCRQQLTALHDECGAALEERERAYSELLEELRVLRRRCPSPRGRGGAVVDCRSSDDATQHRTSAQVKAAQQQSQPMHESASHPLIRRRTSAHTPPSSGVSPRDARPPPQQPASAAAARQHLHEASPQVQGQFPGRCTCSSRAAIEQLPAMTGHDALQREADSDTPGQVQHGRSQQQGGTTGRQSGHFKPSRIPTLRRQLMQPSSPQEMLDSPGCPSAARPVQKTPPAQHANSAQRGALRSPAEVLWPTPPSHMSAEAAVASDAVVSGRDCDALLEEQEGFLHKGAKMHLKTPAISSLRHISGADLDLILGTSGEASEGVAALLHGLELPA